MRHRQADPGRIEDLLPDFCTSSWVVRVLVLCEAVAVILALAGTLGQSHLLERLLLLSVYLQWIGICSAAALCLARRHARRLGPRGLVAVSYVAVVAVASAITEVTYITGRFAGFAPLVENTTHGAFILHSVGISALVAALSLRYFWLRASWQTRAMAETRARLEALQARIEPHFLFNTLNSIASLIALRPADAENAIEDLAALLRARLSPSSPDLVRLDDELKLVTAYARIEKLRLDTRLALVCDIAPAARACRLPRLCLQPLVENAIVHGVSGIAAGGTVSVSARLSGEDLHLRVINPVAGSASVMPGNRQALVNIEQRLALRYGKQAKLIAMQDADFFHVDLIVPAGPANTS